MDRVKHSVRAWISLALLVATTALVLAATARPSPVRAGAGTFTVVVETAFCAPRIQTAHDLLPDRSVCRFGVADADYPELPDGYTTGLLSGDFSYQLTTEDGTTHPWSEFVLPPWRYCNPTNLRCRFRYDYRLDSLTGGRASLTMTSVPMGYRLGWVLFPQVACVDYCGTYPPSASPNTIGTAALHRGQNGLVFDTTSRTATFDIGPSPACESPYLYCLLQFYLFTGEQASGAATPSVPNTSADDPERGIGNLIWLAQLSGVAFLLGIAALTMRVRRR